MATYKLNPQALNDKWGGVVCLELGNTKPDNFDEILIILKDITDNKKSYLISIFETDGRYLGDAEIIFKERSENCYKITQSHIYGDGRVFIFTYYFYIDGRYKREVNQYFALMNETSISQRISALEQKLNEITQTE